MLVITLLFKESLNSLPRNHGRKESKKETNAEIADPKEKEDKDVKTEVTVKKDLAEIDNKEKEEEREDAAETDSI